MNTNFASCPKAITCVAEALGLGKLSDDSQGLDPELLKAIYRHARNDDGQRQLFVGNPTFAKDWVNLEAARAKELVGTFVALDDASTLKQARNIARSNLQAPAWNDVLGIESPPIKCVVKIHGSRWGLRFQSAEPCPRGQEVLNEALPPIPVDVSKPIDACSPSVEAEAPAHSSEPAADGAPARTADDILRLGGMPC